MGGLPNFRGNARIKLTSNGDDKPVFGPRKTAAIDWRVGGMDIDEIQDKLQHSDITTTQRYVDKDLVRQLKEMRQKAA
ncbi:MAG: hypothetical protein ACREKE_09530 [bacterium]